jgi:hypothetical protein
MTMPQNPLTPQEMSEMIDKLIDGWCERRALGPLRIILPRWPPMNPHTPDVQEAWDAFRHLRAACRDELQAHGEYEAVSKVIAAFAQIMHPPAEPSAVDRIVERLIASIFGRHKG